MNWPHSFWAPARFLSEAAGWDRRTDSGGEPSTAAEKSGRRTTVTRVQHVEVIGGNSLPPLKPMQMDEPRRWPRAIRQDPAIVGPPRLPSELINLILLLAAHDLQSSGSIRTSRSTIDSILSLCMVDHLAHRSILQSVLLPSLTLRGAAQVQAFARDALYGAPELRNSLHRVRQLRVRAERRLNEAATPRSGHLYSLADDTARYTRLVTRHLLPVLPLLEGLRSLTLECAPEVLDHRLRNPNSKRLDRLRAGLDEVCCLGTLFAGDLNEAIWLPAADAAAAGEEDLASTDGLTAVPPMPSPPLRWGNLTSLQLHGPRMRLTRTTARALSQLPSLRRLAFISVLIQPPTSPDLTIASSSPRTASSSCVLQELVDGLEPTLREVVYVGHDVEDYVGNAERVRGRLRRLRRRWMDDVQGGWRPEEATQRTRTRTKPRPTKLRVRLITASLASQAGGADGEYEEDELSLSSDTRTPPALFSRWMMDRTERGLQWRWGDEDGDDGNDEVNGSGHALTQVFEAEHHHADDTVQATVRTFTDRSERGFPRMRYVVESWVVPCVAPPPAPPFARAEGGGEGRGGRNGTETGTGTERRRGRTPEGVEDEDYEVQDGEEGWDEVV